MLEELAHLGSDLLPPNQYLAIQAHFPLDEKGSSWLLTPPALRELGGLYLETTAIKPALSTIMGPNPIIKDAVLGLIYC